MPQPAFISAIELPRIPADFLKLKDGTKINWKKGKINKAELTMKDEYTMFGHKIDSETAKVTVYYTSK